MNFLSFDDTFQRIVDAIAARRSLSIVRMSDGSDGILTYCKTHAAKEIAWVYDEGWRRRFGIDGITCGEIKTRLDRAFHGCTYFAPDGHVNYMQGHYPVRDVLVPVTYAARMTHEQKRAMLAAAGHVVLINRDPRVGVAFRSAVPDVKFTQLELNDWRTSEEVRKQAEQIDAPLVLLSGGEASRYLAPALAVNRVALDVGTQVDDYLWADLCPRGSKLPMSR